MNSKLVLPEFGLRPLLTSFALIGLCSGIVAALPAPVAYWDFDEGSGTILHDRTGNGHDGTIVGSPVWTVGGTKANALSFNGSTHVEIPASTSVSSLHSFTLSAWFWQDSQNSATPIMEFSRPGYLSGLHMWTWTGLGNNLPGSFRVNLRLGGSANVFITTSANVSPIGRWNHSALTFDNSSSTARLFINGVIQGSTTVLAGQIPSLDGFLYLGWRSTQTLDANKDTTFLGRMDEVRIYSTALSTAQIDSLFSLSMTPTPPSNLSYSANPAVYGVGMAISPNTPNVTGTPTISYSVTPALPAGLTLNATTGIISGTPTAVSAAAFYSVTATNNQGITSISVSIAVSTNPTGQAHFSLNSSTVALWTFNAKSNGTFLDASPNAFHLPNANTFALASSPFDSAVVLTGSGYLSRPSTTALTIAGTGKLTFEVRVFMTQYPSTNNTGGISKLAGNYEGVSFGIYSNGSIGMGSQKVNGGVGTWRGSLTASGIVPLNRWVDLAASFDNSTGDAYLYIDGTPVQSYVPSPYIISTAPWRTSTSAFCVGGTTTDNQPFNGKIDEVRVSNNLVFGTGLPSIAGNPPTTSTAPSNFSYSQNPAVYGVGVAITPNIPTLAGTTPISYSITPALPAGLSLNITTGVISGTPTAVSAAAYYVVTASNSYGITSTSVGITVQTTPPPSNLSYSNNPASYLLGTPIIPNAATVRGTPPFTFSVSPVLPPGLTLNTSTGTISGTPTTARAVANYVVTASNTAGSTTITLVIATGMVVVGLNLQPDFRIFTLQISGASSMRVSLPKNSQVERLEILDMRGQKIWESKADFGKGERSLAWNGKANGQTISGGLYFARITLVDLKRNQLSTTVRRIVYSP